MVNAFFYLIVQQQQHIVCVTDILQVINVKLNNIQKIFAQNWFLFNIHTGWVKIFFQGGNAIISNSMTNEFYTK